MIESKTYKKALAGFYEKKDQQVIKKAYDN